MRNPFKFESLEDERRFNFVPVDTWRPRPFNLDNKNLDLFDQDQLFISSKGAIMAPVSWFFYGPSAGIGNTKLDFFVTATKKCYNSQPMRDHTCLYANYFEKFYDKDKEYFAILCNMKWSMTAYPAYYNEDAFIHDFRRYMLSPSMLAKTRAMCDDNYLLNLSYKNITNPSLQYTNEHAIMMMQVSVLINLSIPLLTHYASEMKIGAIDDFLLLAYDEILDVFSDSADMYNKFYDTSYTNTSKNEQANRPLWLKQDIRGKNITTHSLSSTDNVILNIVPKYVFNQNVVSLNFASINNNTGFQVIDIEFEFNYVSLSSSKRDDDSISEWDKFESSQIKQNEALMLHNKVNAEETMKTLDVQFGPFDDNEINYYFKALSTSVTISSFQKQLIFNLFYKYFVDPVSTLSTTSIDYVKMMLIAKRILLSNGMIVLPYVICSKIEKLTIRKAMNKRDLQMSHSSPTFQEVVKKCGNSKKVIQQLDSIIATIIASDFRIVDKDGPLDGVLLETPQPIVSEEIWNYYLLV